MTRTFISLKTLIGPAKLVAEMNRIAAGPGFTKAPHKSSAGPALRSGQI